MKEFTLDSNVTDINWSTQEKWNPIRVYDANRQTIGYAYVRQNAYQITLNNRMNDGLKNPQQVSWNMHEEFDASEEGGNFIIAITLTRLFE